MAGIRVRVLGGHAVLRGLVAAGVVLALAVTLMWRGRGYWLGNPSVVVGQVQDATIFGAPIVALYAAWLAGQSRSFGEQVAVAPRPRQQVDLWPLAMATVVGVVPYGLVLAWMLSSLSWRSFTQWMPDHWASLIATVAILVGSSLLWSGVGVLIGRRLPPVISLLAAPLCAYASYVLLAVYLSDGPLRGLSIGGNLVYSDLEPSQSTWVKQGLFWTAVGGLAWVALVAHRRWLVTLFAWLAGGLAALLIITGFSLQAAGTPTVDCRDGKPRVCVDSRYQRVLAAYDQEVRQLWARLPSPLRPNVVADSVAAATIRRSQPVAPVSLLVAGPISGNIEPSNVLDRRQLAILFGDSAIRGLCTGNAAFQDKRDALTLWWRKTNTLPLDASGQVGARSVAAVTATVKSTADMLLSMSPVDRDAWVQREFAGC